MTSPADSLKSFYRSLDDRARLWLIAGAFMLLNAVVWLVIFKLFWFGDKTITDTPIYFDYASRVVKGLFPYRDFSSEYPPLALLFFILPRLLSGPDYGMFVWWFELEMLFFSFGIIAIIANVSWRLWESHSRTAYAVASYTAFTLCLGSIVEARFDIAVAFLILASLACFVADRSLAAWLLLGLGIMTKIIPVLIAPLYIIIHLRRRQHEEMWLGPLAMLIMAAIIATPFLVASADGLASSFLYHAERPLQLESSWSSPLLILSKLGYQVQIMNSYGSHNVFASASDTLVLLSGLATMLVLACIYWLFHRTLGNENACGRATGGGADDGGISNGLFCFAAISIAAFIFLGKVFSPQFLIWLLPLMALIRTRNQRLVTGLFASVLLLTQWEFPYRYWELFLIEPEMVITVALRNALLGLLVVVMIWSAGDLRRNVRLPAPAAV